MIIGLEHLHLNSIQLGNIELDKIKITLDGHIKISDHLPLGKAKSQDMSSKK